MSGLSYERSFRELVVYQKSRLLTREIFMHTKFFPKDEMHFLTGQIRRSSRLIGANIAEAWANRREEARFINRLTDADAEQLGTQHWIEVTSDCGYIDQEADMQLVKRCQDIGRLLNGMIERAGIFCDFPQTVREEISEYFIGTTNWSLPVTIEQAE
jgi:four helix bundle protein